MEAQKNYFDLLYDLQDFIKDTYGGIYNEKSGFIELKNLEYKIEDEVQVPTLKIEKQREAEGILIFGLWMFNPHMTGEHRDDESYIRPHVEIFAYRNPVFNYELSFKGSSEIDNFCELKKEFFKILTKAQEMSRSTVYKMAS